MLNNQQIKCLKIIEWFTFFGLCCLSAFFMSGVLDKFISGKTGFAQSEEPIKELPTITFCFSETKTSKLVEYEYGQDFKIEYRIWFGSDNNTVILKEGENSTLLGEIVSLNKITTRPHDMFKTCYMLISISDSLIKDMTEIMLHFNESISINDLPSLEIYITSKKNAYGAAMQNYWKNGNVIISKIEKGFTKQFDLKAQQYNYDKKISTCSLESFYECLSRLLNTKLEGSHLKCAPISLPNIPNCRSNETNENWNLLFELWNKLSQRGSFYFSQQK